MLNFYIDLLSGDLLFPWKGKAYRCHQTVIGSKLLLKTYDEGFFGSFLAGDEKTLRQSLDRIPAAVEGLKDETERRA